MQRAERVAVDFPMPSRNFTATRRVLLVVLAVSILFPLACLAGYGYFDYQRRIADSNDMIDRLVRVTEEQAVKVLDLNQQMASRIVELIGTEDDAQIRARERQLNQQLREIGGDFPQVASIYLIGAHGDLLVSTRAYPAPPVSVSQREDFVAARAMRPHFYFSLPMHGALSQTNVFSTAIGRIGANGEFLGVVSVALRTEYFSRFYRELTNGDPSLALALYRQDGNLLVRYPPWPGGAKPPASDAFAAALRDKQLSGHVRVKSPVDGVERLVTFRRVGDYPLYVTSAYARASIVDAWRQHFLVIAALTAVPCIAIWILVIYSLRQLEAERVAWERWQGEVAMRLSAEASSRQLQRMGALGNLVANVAHDFNNLLMVVSANIELARLKRYNNLEKEMNAVQRATATAESLTRRLLSVAKKQPLKQEPIDLKKWMPGAAPLIEAALGDHIELAFNIVDDVWQVLADPTDLELAIMNLAVNARDAMPRGGRFVIRCQNNRLVGSDTLLPDGEYVLIACSDDGEGMPESVARRAFEPLFTTKLSGSGAGLGLAQVLSMCEQAGGTAKIDSVQGSGTTVRLYLPRHRERRPTNDVPQQAVEQPALRHAGLVLLVEDNEDVAAGVAAVLETFGCEVRHEPTADQAFDVLTGGERFELVLSDIQMPGKLNGIDLAEKVRNAWPSQKIALMTGYADELERARRLGVAILAKPFNIEELHALVACES
ncbi:response regulator [bacterium M00.F.Ca.ET.228.01.1.1]|uniref:ATP-binding protein n=1 Tax=Paraburkholderia phenoliruptrix TaxID=252970 RepID=UPI0010921DEB|nr:response regulator [Paraburkholderia phenoliruptrix]MBW9096752.1 response regulator [Paraburkholderia phenoliruptrix]TGP46261.1 response regulator [bacterium M00.F.Ca.ET.228.01.1.1]TGS03825.1 response regulator [bacterium M00.F.Ca.ET.191.01.1.1]TGU07555.1 response regulator [bacterium M00.F.Ca.ET.155.01.1.1]